MNLFKTALAAAVLAVLPLAAHAESDVTTAAGPSSASARLDFQVVIPRVLFLQVGTGSDLADNTGVDMITFNVPAGSVGAGGAGIAGTGGTTGPSGVTARLVGNGGNITLSASTAGALNNGTAAETISFSQITSASNNANLPAPTLVDGVGAGTLLTATNKVVDQTATWTYNYANTVTPAAGTYGGAGINNGRVTYTASMP